MFERITDFWRILATKWKVLIIAALALGVLLVAVGPKVIYCAATKACGPDPGGPRAENIGDLNNGVFKDAAERQQYYHTSQGSEVMPYDWFVSLEQGGSDRPFIDDDNLARFGFIPDTNTVGNPDKLPVGFAKDDPDPVTGQVNVGLSCATCHTARIDYQGKFVTVDGAPGRLNFDNFLAAMVGSLTVTAAPGAGLPGGKFDRFAHRVLDREGGYALDKAVRLRADVLKYIDTQLKNQKAQKEADRRQGATATPGGYGRIDALGAGGNRLYGQLDPKNLRTLNAPVKVLPLWHTHQYDWVQTNGSIRQPMARNIIEALAVNASLVFPGTPSKDDIYVSSVRTKNMFWMEDIISRFKAPVWPEPFLGKLDPERIKRGEAHYQKFCASCHAPQMENKPEPADQTSTQNDKKFFRVQLWPADKVGTDPTDAKNFAERTLDASSIGKSANEPGANIIHMVLQGIIDRQYRDQHLPVEQQVVWNGYRDNLLRACVAYPARPLAGIWAASPYLHNGSVPTLYDLLLPPEQRPKKFCTSTSEFDPVHVGYRTDTQPCTFELDTSLTGNSNAGHAYGTTLTPDERLDLIEYLKDLKFPEHDFNFPTVDPSGPSCP